MVSSHLFTPIRLGGVDMPNRIAVSAMCQYSATDGCATDWHMIHLGGLAMSGAGLLVLEATAVEQAGRITHGCLGLYSDVNEAALAPVIAACRQHGQARLGIQLAHAGRKGSAQRPWEGGRALGPNEAPWETFAPSSLSHGEGWHTPTEMTRADMERVRDAHVAAAHRAERLGFDLVEVHAAHGYLLHEFLSPIANQREDAFGGSLENRMRFPLEVVKAVRAVWPTHRALGIRITGSDWVEGGITLDEAATFAIRLKAAGVDFACVSSGAVNATAIPKVEPGYQVPFAAHVRARAGLPVRAVGMITTPEQAETIIAEGQADMVALARGFLDNPRWGFHAAQTLGIEIPYPAQYERAAPKLWPGAPQRHEA